MSLPRLVRVLRQPTKRLGILSLHVINVACIIHLVQEHIGWLTFVSGPSMIPTMAQDGEVCVESLVSPRSIARGDLVTLRSPLDPTRLVCKRVLGLPGDTVCVDPMGTKAPPDQHVLVPRGHLWLVGDNAAAARDSRDYGPVSMALIRGKMVARIWPPSKFTIFRNPLTYID